MTGTFSLINTANQGRKRKKPTTTPAFDNDTSVSVVPNKRKPKPAKDSDDESDCEDLGDTFDSDMKELDEPDELDEDDKQFIASEAEDDDPDAEPPHAVHQQLMQTDDDNDNEEEEEEERDVSSQAPSSVTPSNHTMNAADTGDAVVDDEKFERLITDIKAYNQMEVAEFEVADLDEFLSTLQEKWEVGINVDPYRLAEKRYGVRVYSSSEHDDIVRKLQKKSSDFKQEITLLSLMYCRMGEDDGTAKGREVGAVACKLYQTIYYTFRLLHNSYLVHRLHNPTMSDTSEMQPTIQSIQDMFKPITDKDYSKTMRFILFALARLQECGYRRVKDSIYSEKVIDIVGIDGKKKQQRTRAWEKVSSIKKWVYQQCNSQENAHQWVNMMNAKGAIHAIEYLTSCYEPKFPDVERQRTVWAFRDGLYVGYMEDEPGSGRVLTEEVEVDVLVGGAVLSEMRTRVYRDLFIPYTEGKLPHHLVACKYIDEPYGEHENVGFDYVYDTASKLYKMDCGVILDLHPTDKPESQYCEAWMFRDGVYIEELRSEATGRVTSRGSGSNIRHYKNIWVSFNHHALPMKHRKGDSNKKEKSTILEPIVRAQLYFDVEFPQALFKHVLGEDHCDSMYRDKTNTMGVHLDLPEHKQLSNKLMFYDGDDNVIVTLMPLDKPPKSWVDLPTPIFDKIVEDQEMNRSVKKTLLYMIGRLYYPLNFLDHWERLPFIEGIAGCGKSTLIEFFLSAYSKGDVGHMANEGEELFGLWPLFNNFVWACVETRKSLTLPQSSFQSMITGEEVTMPRKFEDPVTEVWDLPGIMVGNEIPDMTDNSGSVSRRLLVWSCNKHVKNADMDTKLSAKLHQSLPQHIRKTNIGYLLQVQVVGERKLDDFLDIYFEKTKEKVKQNTNALEAFMAESAGELRYGDEKTVYIPKDEFNKHFKAYCLKEGLKTQTLRHEYYRNQFTTYEVVPVFDQKKYNGVMTKKQEFFCGVDLASRTGHSSTKQLLQLENGNNPADGSGTQP